MRVNAFRKRALSALFAGSVYPGSVLISENARPIWATAPTKTPTTQIFRGRSRFTRIGDQTDHPAAAPKGPRYAQFRKSAPNRPQLCARFRKPVGP